MARKDRQVLVRFLGRMVGDADAEDLAQIALAKAAAALDTFRGEASPRGWLFRIATNAAHDWNRSRQGAQTDALPAEDEETPDGLIDDAVQERSLVREEMSRCVAGVLRKLPESYQTVLALSDCEELSDRDVAAALNLTVGAAKIRLHRARIRLKEELERACSFYRDTDNVLCCDRKQVDVDQKESTQHPYRFDRESRLQVESRMDDSSENQKQEHPMVETLPTKQKHLIGVGAAVAAGCQPCTSSFVAAAHEAGACIRGVRLAIEAGLKVRSDAAAAMTSFVDSTFAKPEVDAAFKAERKQLEALIGVAAALAGNTPSLLGARVLSARALGATDEQIRLAGQIGVTARRGAEREADAALARALGESTQASCCSGAPAEAAGTCGCKAPEPSPAPSCGCSSASEPEFETLRLQKTGATCSVCETYSKEQAAKPVVVMSCEGACLRGEISRQAANWLCHDLLPEKTVRLCLGGAFTKNGGQRGLVRDAKRVVALEGCSIRCASRMMRAHFPDLAADVIVADGLCEFDRSLFGIDALPKREVERLGIEVAGKVAARL